MLMRSAAKLSFDADAEFLIGRHLFMLNFDVDAKFWC